MTTQPEAVPSSEEPPDVLNDEQYPDPELGEDAVDVSDIEQDDENIPEHDDSDLPEHDQTDYEGEEFD